MSYILILFFSFLIPFLLSFEKNIFFISKLRYVLLTILILFPLYITWDVIFTSLNIWGFSNNNTVGLKVFNLPLEEILFFIVIPYILLFIYEVINYYINDKEISLNRVYIFIPGFLLIIMGLIFTEKIYTSFQFIFTGFVLLFIFFRKLNSIFTRNFLIYVVLTSIGFLVVNYFLTAIPVVTYNESEIIGFRIITIPLEDFFYHISYSTLIVIVYKSIKKEL